jgi:3-methyladenine DNA glycosylase AlkD
VAAKRDRNLHEAAVVVARRLRESESRAARWVASDALRELAHGRIAARIRG